MSMSRRHEAEQSSSLELRMMAERWYRTDLQRQRNPGKIRKRTLTLEKVNKGSERRRQHNTWLQVSGNRPQVSKVELYSYTAHSYTAQLSQ
jgi:hypothetical protein